jgi:hypothetical protein
VERRKVFRDANQRLFNKIPSSSLEFNRASDFAKMLDKQLLLVATGVGLTRNKHKLWGSTLVRLSKSVEKADYRAISERNS